MTPQRCWYYRLTRAVDLLTSLPSYRRLQPATELARCASNNQDRDTALIEVASYSLDRGLCLDGTLRFIKHVFELSTEDVLRILAIDADTAVQAWIAGDRKLPADAAWVLTRSLSTEARANLAGNRNIPAAVLCRLRHDPEPEVRQRAGWNLDSQTDIQTKAGGSER